MEPKRNSEYFCSGPLYISIIYFACCHGCVKPCERSKSQKPTSVRRCALKATRRPNTDVAVLWRGIQRSEGTACISNSWAGVSIYLARQHQQNQPTHRQRKRIHSAFPKPTLIPPDLSAGILAASVKERRSTASTPRKDSGGAPQGFPLSLLQTRSHPAGSKFLCKLKKYYGLAYK